MTIGEILNAGAMPRSEAELLLAAFLKRNRTWVLAHGEHPLSSDQEREWHTWEQRRSAHEPIAYITGEAEFYGRKFFVDRSVLIPRPSTEGLVEMTLEILNQKSEIRNQKLDTGIVGIAHIWGTLSDVQTIVDIGTGSGCIAITLALERPDLRIIATDISNDALEVAQNNAERHGVSISRYIRGSNKGITFLLGNLLDPIHDLAEPFLIVSNPPYIPEGRTLPRDVEVYEPREALYGGTQGFELMRELSVAAKAHPCCRGMILECETEQAAML